MQYVFNKASARGSVPPFQCLLRIRQSQELLMSVTHSVSRDQFQTQNSACGGKKMFFLTRCRCLRIKTVNVKCDIHPEEKKKMAGAEEEIMLSSLSQ